MRRGEWVGGATRTRKLRLGSCDTRDPENIIGDDVMETTLANKIRLTS